MVSFHKERERKKKGFSHNSSVGVWYAFTSLGKKVNNILKIFLYTEGAKRDLLHLYTVDIFPIHFSEQSGVGNYQK